MKAAADRDLWSSEMLCICTPAQTKLSADTSSVWSSKCRMQSHFRESWHKTMSYLYTAHSPPAADRSSCCQAGGCLSTGKAAVCWGQTAARGLGWQAAMSGPVWGL